MPWIATVTLDPDKSDVGIASAIWNKGLSDEFKYSRRVKISVAEKNAFVTEAKAALAASQNQNTKEVDYSTQLTQALNA